MGVHHGQPPFPPQSRDQVKGHKVATHRDKLASALARQTDHRHKRPKSLHLKSRGSQWVMAFRPLEPWAIHDRVDTIRAQPIEKTVNRHFGSAPFSRIEFSE